MCKEVFSGDRNCETSPAVGPEISLPCVAFENTVDWHSVSARFNQTWIKNFWEENVTLLHLYCTRTDFYSCHYSLNIQYKTIYIQFTL